MSLGSASITTLAAGDFDGLRELHWLNLFGNQLTVLPSGIFGDLSKLTILSLNRNALTALPDGVFNNLTNLILMRLQHNELNELPDRVFEPLRSLQRLQLHGNPGADFSPTAVAQPDNGTVPDTGGMVTLDSSGSGGAWGSNVTYSWALTSPATGVDVTFDDNSISTPTVTIPPLAAGITELTFTLTVTAVGALSGITTGVDTATVRVMDETAPRVASITRQSPTSSPTNADAPTWLVTFNEDVANVDAADFMLSGTTATLTVSTVTASSAYSVMASGGNLDALDGTVTLTFAAGQDIADIAGHALANTTPTGTNDNTYLVDNTAPTVTISGVPANSGVPFTAAFTFSQGVTGFAATDITLGNGVASSFMGSAGDTAYTALITPTDTGTVTLDVAAGVAMDLAGNDNTAAARAISTYDSSYDPSLGICGRTGAVRTGILGLISGVSSCADVTTEHLAAIASTNFLNLNSKGITTIAAGDFAGLTSLGYLWLSSNQLTSLPDGIFDELTGLTSLTISNNSLTALPDGIFDNLTALKTLWLDRNNLSTLPGGIFDNLTALISLQLHSNQLATLPDGVFESLTSLAAVGLRLQGNPGASFSPTAVAMPDSGTVAAAGGDVMLDGSGSSGGAWGSNVTYSWALTSPTTGVEVTFDDDTSATPTVTIPPLAANTELTFTLTVTGRGGTRGITTATDTAKVGVANNTAPTAAAGSVTTSEDTPHTFDAADFNFSDTDSGDALASVKIESLPTTGTGELQLDNVAISATPQTVTKAQLDAGSLEYVPPANANGPAYASFNFKVNDGAADSAAPYIMTLNVTAVNDAPVLDSDIPDQTATVDTAFSYAFPEDAFSDVDDSDTLTYAAAPSGGGTLPPWLGFAAATRTFSGTPQATDVGTMTVKVTATDSGGETAEDTFNILVSAPADVTAPRVTSITRQTPASSPTNSDSLVWLVTFSEDVANVNADDFEVAGTDATLSVSTVTASTAYSVTASGGNLGTLDATVTLSFASGHNIADTASNPNPLTNTVPTGKNDNNYVVDNTAPTAPTYTAPASLQVGVAIAAMSPTGGIGIDEYSATGLPPGLSIAAATGVIGGTPDTAQANTASVTVTVSDTAGNTGTVDITFPAVAKGDQTLTGFGYSASSVAFGSAAPTVTAPGGVVTTLSYSATPSTACSVDSTTGALTLAGVGDCVITATAAGTDDYNEATTTFTVAVQAAGALVLNLDAVATDNTINIDEKAAGFTISGDTGTESGVDVTVRIGTGTLTATSADNAGTATWSVNVPADASYISGTSVEVQVSASKTGYTAADNVTRTLTVDLTAPTAPTYTAPASLKVGVAIAAVSPSGGIGIDEYGTTGLPPGLGIAAATGVISGTPVTADANTADAAVTVSDTAGNTAGVSITFPAVAKGDQSLTGFGYSASSVAFGSTAPTVTAPGGVETTLSYSATPSTVCSVDSTTGALTLAGVGDCVITATAAGTNDYTEATAMFTVTVQAVAALVLNLDTIAEDNRVNIAEKIAGFTISGDTGTESGVEVTVRIGIGTLTATSADNAGTATWSVSVPADASYITGTSVDVAVNATKTGYTAPDSVTRTLTVDLTAPTAPTYRVPGSLKVGVAIAAVSPTGGTGIDEYGATGLPPGLGIAAATGAISGTPDTADANTADATVTVRDTAGNTAEVSITFPAVARGDQALTGFGYSASSVAFGSAAPTVTAPGGVVTTLSYSATPSTACTVNASSGALTLAGVGNCVITATAAGTDDYNEATARFTVAVQAVGALVLNLDAVATDNTVNIDEKTAGFTISGDTGSEAGVNVTVTVGATELTATSAEADPATWSVSVPADASYITGPSVAVQVNASKTGYTSPSAVQRTLTVDLTAPTAPTYTAPGSLKVGVAIAAMSPSGGIGIDAYSATGLPPGLGIDTGTGVISGTPVTADANTASVTVTASDTPGNTAEVSITFPAVAKGDQTLTGFVYSASSVTLLDSAPSVTAPTGVQTTLSYSATPSAACTVNASSGALTLAGVGNCVITATAAGTDDYNETTAMFTVTVQAAGALVLNLDTIAEDNRVNIAEKTAGFTISGDTGTESGVDVTVTVGATELTATSAQADPATWSVSVPADASYITGASVDVAVNASKTGYTSPSAVQRTLTVDLTAPTAPTYTAPASLQVGVAITAMSPTGGIGIDAYSATGLPPGLGIAAATGAISGTPDTAQASTADATVTVSDTAGNTAEVSITFPAVARGDQTLTGFGYSASSVAFGSTAPTVTAPGGVQTTLSYSATPSTVCSVDSTTGALTLAGLGDCVITATAAGADDYNEATARFTVAVRPAGALVLNLDAVATDNTINIDEKTAGFTISGDTGTESGVDVTVTVGATQLTATSADADPATWSVSVPADASYITGASVDVAVNASKTGYTAPDSVTRALTVDLTAPTAPTYTTPASLKVGVAITAVSPTGGTGIDAYSATGLPPGLGIAAATGAISGTPDTAQASTADATVTVSDLAGNTAEVSITFPAVAKGDQTLTGFGYSASSVAFDSTAPTVTAPTGAQTTLGYSATPSTVCSVDSTTGALTLAGVGDCVITATAAGTANYNETTVTFTVAVRTAGALVLNLDTVATDNTINIAEKAAGFAISGDTGSQASVSVTVTVGATELTATSADADPATWSVSVPADASYIAGASVDVTVSATKAGFTAPDNVTRTLTVDLTAPTAPTYTAPASLKVGVAIAAMSPTGGTDIDEYGATGLPPGLGIAAAAGAISGTPDTADANTADAAVTVSDTAGNTAEVSITFPAVARGDQTLTGFAYSASSVAFGSTAPTVTAPGGVETTLSYSATPSTVCSVDSTTGALTLADVGDCLITATAAGTANYNETTVTFTVTVQAAGALVLNLDTVATDNTINIDEKAAGFTISGDTGPQAGVSVTVTVGATELTATSADADPATWSVSVPADANYITGTSVDVTVNATKTGYTAADSVTRTLTVDLTAPTAPTYTAPASLQVGVAIAAMSPSGGTGIDEYGATGLPPGLGISAATGAISGTPVTAEANTASVTVTVSDAAGNTAEVSITFPAVAKGDQTLTGFGYSASSVTLLDSAPSVTAPTGVQTTLSYSATPSTVCSVDSTTGALTLEGAGDCVITAEAAGTDDYDEATVTFTVAVQAVGALVLNLDTIAEDNRVNIAEKTAGFTISGDTGTESGVEVTVRIGTGTLTATSADDNGTATWSVSVPADASYITGASVDVAVNATKTGYTAPDNVTRTLTVDLTAPTAPTYTAPGSLKVGVAITAMSPTGGIGIDEYKATGLPPGLSIDTGTGAISGTPDTADANTADATVTVSDTAGNTGTVDIAFPAVAKGDQSLTGFQYSASSVAFGSTAPTVTAPGGVKATLAYSATPSTVCSVDSTTGALTLAGVGSCVITATAAGTANYNETTVTFTVAVQAAGALVLNLDTIAEDNRVNIAEKTAGFTISGDTGTESGVDVTVTVGTTELTATSAQADPATWSVSVPADASYITGASVDVAVNASKTGYTSPSAVQRTLTVDLTAPTAPTYTAPSALKVGVAIATMSPTGGIGIDAYSATGLPPGLGIAAATGAISGTPDTAQASTADATVTVSDLAGNTAEVSITFPAVARGDQTLTGFGYSASSVAFGSTAPTVTAPTGVQTTLSYSATPSTVCTVTASSGALTLAGLGDCVITATAAGADDYNEATARFTVAVRAAGALVLNLDTIATDDRVNIAEKTAGFTISGDTGTEGSVDVTVRIGTETLTATSADNAGTATWSVSVPADASYITGTSVDVAVNATKTGYTAADSVTRALTVDLTAPTAPTYTAPASLQVGVAITAMSPTGGIGIDAYSATGLPPGLGIAAATGAISGTPDTAQASTADATVTVSDLAGNTAEVSITFPAVAKGDQALTGFGYSASSVAFGSTAPTVTAPGGVETTLSYSATPSTVCSVDSTTGALTLAGVGSCVITATAAGTANYNETTVTFTVTVQAAGALVLNLDTVASDNTINIDEKASGFTISGDTGSQAEVSVTVAIGTGSLSATSADDNGAATWSVSVPADANYITGTSLVVEVNATKTGFTAPAAITRTLTVDLTAPTAPTYTAPTSLQVGVAITPVSPTGGTGIDAYSATGLPPGLGIDTGTGAISGTPVTADANTADATVTVSDAGGNSGTVDITFPTVAKGDQTLTGFGYSASSAAFASAAPTVTAPGGVVTTLSYSATPSTACTVVSTTGALTLAGVGDCVITATAAGTDDYNEATATFTVTVQAAGALVLNLDTVATDNTINIDEKAAGFTISGDTGPQGAVSVTVTVGATELTATSAEADPATWSVSVPVDANYITGASLVVEVNATKTGFSAPAAITRTLTVDLTAPTAPTYTVPASLQVGEPITAMSPSGGSDIDAYSATGLPSGLSIDTGTGVIGGTPDTADANTADATVTISDAAGNTGTVSITFPAVAKGDQTLTGFGYSASSVAFDSTAPTVTAPTGVRTTLSYSATPSTVCSVNASTGALTLAGAGSCAITATAPSTANYNEATVTFTVTVQAASTGVTLTVNPATLDENADATTVTVTGSLGGTPRTTATSVTVSVGASTDTATEGTDYVAVDDVSLTIPAGRASATATFVFTPMEDLIDEPDEAVSITGATELAGFEVSGTTLSIDDNDERGVTVSPTDLTLSEGANATYTLVLDTEPTENVTVTPSVSGRADVTVSAALTFTATDWDQAQTVTVSAAQDADASNDKATIKHAVSGADYGANGAMADDVSVTVDDDETAVLLTVNPAAVDEDAEAITATVTATFDGVTRAEPTILTLTVGASDDAAIAGTDHVAVDDLSLTIPAGQASGTASFTFTPLEDRIDERVEAVSITGTTEAAGFGVSGTTLSITDNDERGVTVSPTDLSVSEGASATYTVVLDTEPTETVTVTPSVSGSPDVAFEPSSLTFTMSDWATAQTVTVSAAQDADAANDTATIGHVIAGADYGANGVTADDVAVTVEDDETAVTLTVNPTAVDEDAEATTVTVTGTIDGVARAGPTTLTLSVGASGDAATEVTDYAAVNDLSLTIPSGQTSGTATFTLTTLDDPVDEPDEALSITGTSRDASFEVIGTTLAITDNDERGVQISPSSLTVSEGGDATYTVVLTSQPTGDVTVTPSLGSGDTDVTVSAALTFTPTDWNQAQTVTVSAARDVDAANDTATIGHTISGADYGANGVTPADVSVTVEDDGTAVTLTVNPAAVDEDGGGTTVTVTATFDGVTRDAPTTLTLSVGASDDAAIAGHRLRRRERPEPDDPNRPGERHGDLHAHGHGRSHRRARRGAVNHRNKPGRRPRGDRHDPGHHRQRRARRDRLADRPDPRRGRGRDLHRGAGYRADGNGDRDTVGERQPRPGVHAFEPDVHVFRLGHGADDDRLRDRGRRRLPRLLDRFPRRPGRRSTRPWLTAQSR